MQNGPKCSHTELHSAESTSMGSLTHVFTQQIFTEHVCVHSGVTGTKSLPLQSLCSHGKLDNK